MLLLYTYDIFLSYCKKFELGMLKLEATNFEYAR